MALFSRSGSPEPTTPEPTGTARTPSAPATAAPVAQGPVGQARTTPVGVPVNDRLDDDRRDLGHDKHGEAVVPVVDPARAKFGGVNLGACLFGWVVAVGVSVLLTGVLGAIVAAVGANADVTQSDAERQAGTVGIVTAVALLVVLMVGYYCGGYVAGRMSRFDGARQGIAVWVIGLLLTLVAIGVGALFGNQYNAFDRVDLPRIYVSDNQITGGAVIASLAVLFGTALAAWLGGVVGRRYHSRVDRAAAIGWQDAAANR